MAEANFWYESNGEQKGPVPASELKQMAASGQLRPTDMIWREGQPDWVAAGSVKGLFPTAAPGSPPPPSSDRPFTQGMYGPAPDLRQATAAAKEASQQAVGAAKLLLNDPIGGIAKAYESLGPTRALPVGIVFLAVLFVIHLLAQIFGAMNLDSLTGGRNSGGFNFKNYLWSLVAVLLFVATLIGVCTLVRIKSNPKLAFSADIFLVGTSLLPLGLSILAFGLFNSILRPNIFLVLVDMSVLIFGFTLTVFLLFSGVTKIHQVTERAATIWVPLMLVAGVNIMSLWFYMRSS